MDLTLKNSASVDSAAVGVGGIAADDGAGAVFWKQSGENADVGATDRFWKGDGMGQAEIGRLDEAAAEFDAGPKVSCRLHGFAEGVPVKERQVDGGAEQGAGVEDIVGIAAGFQAGCDIVLLVRVQLQGGVEDGVGTIGGVQGHRGLLPGAKLVEAVDGLDIFSPLVLVPGQRVNIFQRGFLS